MEPNPIQRYPRSMARVRSLGLRRLQLIFDRKQRGRIRDTITLEFIISLHQQSFESRQRSLVNLHGCQLLQHGRDCRSFALKRKTGKINTVGVRRCITAGLGGTHFGKVC